LLLEPQRSNLVTYSEQFDNAAWTKLDTAATANAAISPDGYTNADKIVPNTTNARHILYQANTTSVVHTLSVFAKAAGQNFLTMRLDDDTPEVNVYFNLSTGTIGSTQGGSPTMTSYGNGWYRCTVTYTPSGTETIYAALGSANQNGVQAYAGNNTDGILLYGAQLEAGAYATSYIPTLGASVTRVADAASKTGISSLIGQTEGTIFFEYPNFNSDFNSGLIGIDDGSGNNRILFYSDTNNRITAQVRTNGVTQQPASYSVSGDVKVAIAYDSTGFVFYANGTLRFTGTSVVFSSTMSVFTYNHVGVGGSITNQALLFKTRLTNAQLAELTA
jgi:hypothetical protein